MSTPATEAQLGLLDQWEQEQDDAARSEEAKLREAKQVERVEHHRRSRKVCWPEWDGPAVGELCDVCELIAQQEDGGTIYAYMEQCRLLEERPDGTWLAVIEMGIVHGKPWYKDGTRLILGDLDIWPPVRQLAAARRAASNPVEK